MFKVKGSEKIPKSNFSLIPSSLSLNVLYLWFGYSQFNELLSSCELCAVPSIICEERPIISVALLLPASLCFLHPMQAAFSCRPLHSCSFSPLDTSFPGPGSLGSDRGECRLLLQKLATNSVALTFKEQSENPRVKRPLFLLKTWLLNRCYHPWLFSCSFEDLSKGTGRDFLDSLNSSVIKGLPLAVLDFFLLVQRGHVLMLLSEAILVVLVP